MNMLVSEVFSSPDLAELAKAMVKVQQALNPACKDAENPFVKNRYATLNSVIEACRDALTAQSVWVAQYPVAAEAGHLGLVTKLVHGDSGQWQSSMMVMPLPKNDPQGYGSALTYARRYGLAICGRPLWQGRMSLCGDRLLSYVRPVCAVR
jgi:hypothetical protein